MRSHFNILVHKVALVAHKPNSVPFTIYIYRRYIKHTFFCIIGLGDIKMALIRLKNCTQNFSHQQHLLFYCVLGLHWMLACNIVMLTKFHRIGMNVMCSMCTFACVCLYGASLEKLMYKKNKAGERTIPICSYW